MGKPQPTEQEVSEAREIIGKHIRRVQELVQQATDNLTHRAIVHDASKLGDDELPYFAICAPILKTCEYGSDEYKRGINLLGSGLKHHYQNNDHHPEFHGLWICPDCRKCFTESELIENGVSENHYWCDDCYGGKYPGFYETALIHKIGLEQMSLMALIEMLCDWKAAGEQQADGGCIVKSIQMNKKRFNISDAMEITLMNTARELGFIKE